VDAYLHIYNNFSAPRYGAVCQVLYSEMAALIFMCDTPLDLESLLNSRIGGKFILLRGTVRGECDPLR